MPCRDKSGDCSARRNTLPFYCLLIKGRGLTGVGHTSAPAAVRSAPACDACFSVSPLCFYFLTLLTSSFFRLVLFRAGIYSLLRACTLLLSVVIHFLCRLAWFFPHRFVACPPPSPATPIPPPFSLLGGGGAAYFRVGAWGRGSGGGGGERILEGLFVREI